MKVNVFANTVFVWGVSSKAAAYKQLKGMFGRLPIVFMPPASRVEQMSDEQLAQVGLRRMTAEELTASMATKQAPTVAVDIPTSPKDLPGQQKLDFSQVDTGVAS